MSNEFALELAKGIEELSIELRLDRKTLTKQAIEILKRQDIDIIQNIKETEARLEVANSKFDNVVDKADIEEAALEVTEAETRLSALRTIAKERNITESIKLTGFGVRR